MTFILTIVGLFVFLVSCFTVGFGRGFKRLAGFVITGIVIDVIIALIFIGFTYVIAT